MLGSWFTSSSAVRFSAASRAPKACRREAGVAWGEGAEALGFTCSKYRASPYWSSITCSAQHSTALTSSWGAKMVPVYVPAVLLLAAVDWNASFTPSHSELSAHRSMRALKFCRATEQVSYECEWGG